MCPRDESPSLITVLHDRDAKGGITSHDVAEEGLSFSLGGDTAALPVSFKNLQAHPSLGKVKPLPLKQQS